MRKSEERLLMMSEVRLLNVSESMLVSTPAKSSPRLRFWMTVVERLFSASVSVPDVSPVSKLPESALATVWESVPLEKLVSKLETTGAVSVEKVVPVKYCNTPETLGFESVVVSFVAEKLVNVSEGKLAIMSGDRSFSIALICDCERSAKFSVVADV